MSRVSTHCISASLSGPVTSNLRRADRSIIATPVRQVRYSSSGEEFGKVFGSQNPLYSMKSRVSPANWS